MNILKSSLNYCNTLSKYFYTARDRAYSHSVFFSMCNQNILKKSHEYKKLSLSHKCRIGVIAGIERLALGICLVKCLEAAFNQEPEGRSNYTQETSNTYLALLLGTVFEEILFRGMLHNCVLGSQKIVAYLTPQCMQNNRVFKWLTSPSSRIITINSLFAIAHSIRGGVSISERESAIHVARLMLLTSYGMLYETTGNIIAPITAHVIHNLSITIIMDLLLLMC